jgi:hypothetical protein
MEIELRHRKAPEEGAEYLQICLKATPNLAAAGRVFLHPFAMAMLPAIPLLLWQQSMAAVMGGWLPPRARCPLLPPAARAHGEE